MADPLLVTAGLALGTFAIRLGGYLLGGALPATGPWARGLNALPGCLIAALLAVLLVQAGPAEWGAAALCAVVAVLTRSLPLTMLVGIGAVWLARTLI
ncbi:AzlD domain-containing protein [Pseudodonghicola xiamenensis]|uniref:Branched-chain amino acid transport protein (AzlD) n=1 Tax=Pseudodonghicola xiamenensis TaxID=337702 RepID=A0A8J3H4U5_9RHOB|nr:AzlD domain-containing protein [Pseudodonghicola xiamenensis]GHG80542.1 hypothetical protein GCM10010961_03780 [Pseudodonghicola xiamenensis]